MNDIRLVTTEKKQYLDLLLLADEQESMIDRYLERGDLFAGKDNGETVAVAVVTEEGRGIREIKNLAVAPACQRQGYGQKMIAFIEQYYRPEECRTLLVGTGDSPLTVPFYRSCGFVYSHSVTDFFIKNYDHPIFECGQQLKDMLYFKKERKI